MESFKIKVSLVIIMSILSVTQASEELSFDVSADYSGKYIWRGQNITDEEVFQPSINAVYGGLTAGIWGNLETTGVNDESGEFTEWDFYFDYTGQITDFEGISYSVGTIYYHFPSTVGDTTEIYGGLGFDLPLNPAITVYYDVDEVDGFYAAASAGYSKDRIAELSPETPIGMDISFNIGWGDEDYTSAYWSVGDSEFQDLTIQIAFPMELQGWTVSPGLNYISVMGEDLREADGQSSDYFFAGINVAKSF
jgi:hypothetical protein